MTGTLEAQPGSPPSGLAVLEQGSMSAFVALEPEWNALVEVTGAVPFLRHECIKAWLVNFAPSAQPVILLARDASGKLVAALPLILERGLICGLPARQLVAAANTHSSRFDLIALDPSVAARALLDYLIHRPGWDLLRIIDVQDGGNAWHIHHAASVMGFPVGVWGGERSPYLTFPRSYGELLASKSPLFRGNLRRRRRQLEKLGTLSVECVRGLQGLPEKLDEGFALERSGWKGRQGTAIAQDPQTAGFYRDVARAAARHGYLRMFFLRLDGRAIAFHYGLAYDGIYYVPKLAYDEAMTGCSPGLVLLEEAIKDGIATGLRGYDFLGHEAEWKTKWSTQVLPNHWLFIFRKTAIGHTLRKAKFEWLPAARRVLKRDQKTRGRP